MIQYEADYYDPHPTAVLARPLVLVGHPGSGVALTGRVVCARTGLPFNDIARLAEASAGMERTRVVAEQGMPELDRLERDALESALSRQPVGVIVMDSRLIADAGCRRALRGQARVAYLRRPVEALLKAIQGQLERAPASLPEFVLGTPRNSEQLARHFEARERALAEFDRIVEAGRRTPTQVASDILESLDALMDAELGSR